MNVPPSLAIYLMHKRRVERPQLKPAIQPAEEINVFHVPASAVPFPIQGTKLGIVTYTDLQPAESENDRETLLQEVQAQLYNLKNVLKLNKKEPYELTAPVAIQDVAGQLSHKYYLDLMTELVYLRKEVQQIRSCEKTYGSAQNSAACGARDAPALRADSASSTRFNQYDNPIVSPQALSRYINSKEHENQLHRRNSYHSDTNEYPNHYDRRGSFSSQSGSCAGIQEDFVQLQRERPQAPISAVEPPLQKYSDVGELYHDSYGPKRHGAAQKRGATDPRKFDNVDKLPHRSSQKRQIVGEIADYIVGERSMPYNRRGSERAEEDILRPRDYSKYGDLRYSDRMISSKRSTQQEYQPTVGVAKQEQMKQSFSVKNKIRVFLPVINAQTSATAISERYQSVLSNESPLRLQKTVTKTSASFLGDDIFRQLFDETLGMMIGSMLDYMQSEMQYE